MLLTMLLLLCGCSYVQYDGADGRNVEIHVRNLTNSQLEYDVIHWRSENLILWIEKTGSIELEPIEPNVSSRRAMRIENGMATIHRGSDVFLLPISEDNELIITSDLLQSPLADG